MAVTTKIYGKFMEHIVSGNAFSWQNDNIKVALLSSGYTPNQDVHAFFSDVQSYEITGTGYTTGGKEITSKSVYYDAATNTLQLKCSDIQWDNATITARYAVIYKDTGQASTSALIAYADFEQSVSATNGTFKVVVPTDGVIKLYTA